MCLGEGLKSLGSGDHTNEFNAVWLSLLDLGNGIDSRAAGSKHRIDNNNVSLGHILRQLAVIFNRLVGVGIAIKTDVSDLCGGKQGHHTVDHSETCAENGHNNQLSSGDHLGGGFLNGGFDLDVHKGQIAGCFIAKQCGDFRYKCTEFFGTGVLFADKGQLMLNERMVYDCYIFHSIFSLIVLLFCTAPSGHGTCRTGNAQRFLLQSVRNHIRFSNYPFKPHSVRAPRKSKARSHLSLLNIAYHLYPFGVASAFIFGVDKKVGKLKTYSGAYHSSAHAENVGVVVKSCVFGAEVVGAYGGTDALNLVGGDGHTDSGTANEYSPIAFSVGNGVRHLNGNFGIIDLFKLGNAEILNLEASVPKMVPDLVFQFKSAVVTANSDFHIIISFQKYILFCRFLQRFI